MSDRANVIYRCDGSFDGLMCCVFESISCKELPAGILTGEEEQLSLLPVREIATDPVKAARVRVSIPKKLGSEAEEMIQNAFLHGEPGRELAILEFMRTAYRYGPRAATMLDLPEVQRVFAMSRAVTHEAHMLTGFIRFTEIGGALVAPISPRHFVLPLLAPHFCERFCEERMLIHDRTHRAALLYRPYEAQIRELDSFEPAAPDEAELLFQQMWKNYYHAISIASRENPRLRMGNMAKRYWEHLTEMQDLPPLKSQRPLPQTGSSSGTAQLPATKALPLPGK